MGRCWTPTLCVLSVLDHFDDHMRYDLPHHATDNGSPCTAMHKVYYQIASVIVAPLVNCKAEYPILDYFQLCL